MSTVCYCGRPDCSVTSMARDACLTTLRAERDALKAQVEAERSEVVQLKEFLAAATARSDENFRSVLRLKAQVEAARRVCVNTMALGDDDVRPQDVLNAMDEAAKKYPEGE